VDIYQVDYRESVFKDYRKIVPKMCEKIMAKVDGLATNPRPAQSKKLQGRSHEYRLRIDDYRVVYTIDDKKKLVTISHVKHRRDVYKR